MRFDADGYDGKLFWVCEHRGCVHVYEHPSFERPLVFCCDECHEFADRSDRYCRGCGRRFTGEFHAVEQVRPTWFQDVTYLALGVEEEV